MRSVRGEPEPLSKPRPDRDSGVEQKGSSFDFIYFST